MLICKKCFKLIDELEELEQRVEEVKDELIGNYQKTLNHINSGTDEDDLESNDIQINEEQHCKTILEIPSSDDENSQVSFLIRCVILHDCYVGRPSFLLYSTRAIE